MKDEPWGTRMEDRFHILICIGYLQYRSQKISKERDADRGMSALGRWKCGERCGERLCFTASRCLSVRWKPVKAWRQIQSFLTYELKRLQSTRLQDRNALPDKVPFWRGLLQTPCLPVNLLLANCNWSYILIGVICKVHVSPAWRGTWRTQTSTLAG